MNSVLVRQKSIGRIGVTIVVMLLASGCMVPPLITAPLKVASATLVVAGETAGAVVTTTGKVMRAAVGTGGSVATGGIESAGKLSRVGMVTFVDAATGAIVRVPWKSGLTLAMAGDTAKVHLAQRTVDIVRTGKLVYAASRYTNAKIPLVSGDVVRLTGD